MRNVEFAARVRAGASVLVSAALAFSLGCTLDKKGEPDLAGPSDSGVSVELKASPDIVNADGVSTVLVRLTVRDEKGRPVAGLPVLFDFTGDGILKPAPGSSYVGPVQTGLVMATRSDGIADVIYVAGWNIGSLIVAVR